MLRPCERHWREGFVDFVKINLANLHARALQGTVSREQWFFEHDHWIACGYRQIMNPRDWRQAVLLERRLRHDQHCRCAVANLAG